MVVVKATNKKNSIKKKQIIKYLKYATISQETNKQIGVMNVVKSIKNKEIPSISKNQKKWKKFIFDSIIFVSWKLNWKESKVTKINIENKKRIIEISNADHLKLKLSKSAL